MQYLLDIARLLYFDSMAKSLLLSYENHLIHQCVLLCKHTLVEEVSVCLTENQICQFIAESE